MGGFANLKKDFDDHLWPLPGEDNEIPAKELRRIANEYLALRCLFEIAGNLDTIALEMRQQTKILTAKFNRE